MASGQPKPATRALSRCTAQKAQGTHTFEINDYSLHEGLGKGKSISSATFDVGGYSWCIDYCPDGGVNEEINGCISVFLALLTKNTEVRAAYDLRLLNQKTGLSCSIFRKGPSIFSTMAPNRDSWGKRVLINRSELESSAYLRGDTIVIQFDVTVVKEPCVFGEDQVEVVQVPPSNLSHNFAKLLETEDGSDVTFSVQGVVFRAHKIVLAVGSQVFKAELYGPVGKDNREFITIQDMQPAIFKALLYFIYTDSMPSMEDRDSDDEIIDFIKHLLVAADRYAVDRLRLICEDILCKHVDARSLATMLVLADQLNCTSLKDACFKYMDFSNPVDNVLAKKQSLKPKRSYVAVLFGKLKVAFRSSSKK